MKKNVLAMSIATAVVDMAEARPVLHTIGHNTPLFAPQFGSTGMLLVPYYGGFAPWWLRASGQRNEDQFDFRRLLG